MLYININLKSDSKEQSVMLHDELTGLRENIAPNPMSKRILKKYRIKSG